MTCKMILVVDDDADIRESLRDAFEDAGYVVRCARNGLEALEMLRVERPCAVVLDLMMPRMSGTELFAVMQADGALARIPIVVSTSDPSRAPSGAIMMPKPVRLDSMLTTIAALCERFEGPESAA